MKKKTLWWIIGAFVLLLIILIAVGKKGDGNLTKVATEKTAKHTITETVTASGKIYPETEVKLSPEVSGEIIELTVDEGDSVHKGQLLVKINPAVYNSIVNQASASVSQSRASASNTREMMGQAQSQYDLALATYKRNQKLYQEKVISALEFEQAEANYKSAKATYEASKSSTLGGGFGVAAAEANLNQAQENLLKTTIVAPTSGIISSLNVKKGERVLGTAQMQGTDMLSIADMSRIEVRVDVSETDIAKVKIGDTTTIEADAYRNRKFTGIVSKVGVSSNKSGVAAVSTDQVTNYTVHILILPSSYADLATTLPKGRFVFKPGMSASVEIQTRRERDVLSVPVNAVTTRDWPDSIKNKNKNSNSLENNDIRQVVFVYDAKLKQVALRDVKTGIQDNLYIQILSGLKDGEEIVTAPYGAIARILKDKTKVQTVAKDKLFEAKTED
ncbi:efflux RND transporter periplasmic adaptor subunit [Taibaiella soli]|uniref:Efflux RND transporter periplasmic adaptor subunit n=1 Tax=Taibaiella soli TaxID=1649169 RepID=A0A2W2A8T5_9BACT|nr:efflux RND transporter periplasmic adaptor subunit [Taibaiella soli]PZF71725.1 efflux RND transporter periplasmic adaptor subunit [Taibaiella soli]